MPINFAKLHKHIKFLTGTMHLYYLISWSLKAHYLGRVVVQEVALLLGSCVALGRLHNVSMPQFPTCKIETTVLHRVFVRMKL